MKNDRLNENDIVIYTSKNGQYIGRILWLEEEYGIAYVWYGIGGPAATKLDDLALANLDNIDNTLCNYDLMETVFQLYPSQNTFDVASLYMLVRKYNHCKDNIEKINELDYILQLDGSTESFSQVIKAIKMRKGEWNRCLK